MASTAEALSVGSCSAETAIGRNRTVRRLCGSKLSSGMAVAREDGSKDALSSRLTGKLLDFFFHLKALSHISPYGNQEGHQDKRESQHSVLGK